MQELTLKKIPKKLLATSSRRAMWKNAREIIKKPEKVLPVAQIYLRGSFSSKKRRPADVDFIILLKTKSGSKKSNWPVDFVVCPENKHGELIVKDAAKWMAQKYGKKNSAILRLK